MRSRVAIVALVAVACGSTAVLAQGRGGRGFGGFGRMSGFGGGGISEMALVNVEAVQKELELIDDQIEQIVQLRERLRPQRGRDERPNFREMSQEERQEWIAQRAKQAAETAAKAKEELKNILLDDQLARLQQIYVQVAGTQALTNPDVASKLGLSADQTSKIESTRQEAQADMRAQMRELFQSGDRQAMQEKMAEMRKAADEKILAVLTAEQKEQFAAMKGEPFEMPEGALRGGRRGRAGGQGRFGGGQGRFGGGDRPQRPE